MRRLVRLFPSAVEQCCAACTQRVVRGEPEEGVLHLLQQRCKRLLLPLERVHLEIEVGDELDELRRLHRVRLVLADQQRQRLHQVDGDLLLEGGHCLTLLLCHLLLVPTPRRAQPLHQLLSGGLDDACLQDADGVQLVCVRHDVLVAQKQLHYAAPVLEHGRLLIERIHHVVDVVGVVRKFLQQQQKLHQPVLMRLCAMAPLHGLGLDGEEDVDQLRCCLTKLWRVVQKEVVRVLHCLKVNQVVPDKLCEGAKGLDGHIVVNVVHHLADPLAEACCERVHGRVVVLFVVEHLQSSKRSRAHRRLLVV
mmetsp:Transcript_33440/g.72982  ORF Transcript_33440/g.72982 Transcript_33440/m.72982 type:complete len:307 (-) Transcript_33440:922-1842(-)